VELSRESSVQPSLRCAGSWGIESREGARLIVSDTEVLKRNFRSHARTPLPISWNNITGRYEALAFHQGFAPDLVNSDQGYGVSRLTAAWLMTPTQSEPE
jgi:hypothetical protein